MRPEPGRSDALDERSRAPDVDVIKNTLGASFGPLAPEPSAAYQPLEWEVHLAPLEVVVSPPLVVAVVAAQNRGWVAVVWSKIHGD